MNGETILDAMNYLDEDLIEAAAKLRRRKRRPHWLVAAAACLCLFVLLGRSPSKNAPMESDKAENLFSGTSDQLKQESAVESPMEPTQTLVSILCISELGEDFFIGTVQEADGGEGTAETLKVFCDPETAASVAVGDMVRIVYTEENGCHLLEFELINKAE